MVRCFLFGAGASKACDSNIPIMTDFLRLAEDYEFKEKYHHILALFNKHNVPYDKYNFNFEKIIDDINKSEINSTTKSDLIYTLKLCLCDLIYNPSKIRMSSSIQTPYDKLMQKLNIIDNKDDFFITLNYDLLLDSAIWKKNQIINSTVSQYRIDYGIGFDFESSYNGFGGPHIGEENSRNIIIRKSVPFTLYKLHGSFNWLHANNDKSKIHCQNKNYTDNTSDLFVLITPTIQKEITKINSQLKELYDNLKTRLLTTKIDEFIIIGCSLSRDDTYLLDLIKIAKNINPQLKLKVVYFHKTNTEITPDTVFENYCRSLLPNTNIIFCPSGFDDDCIDNFIF